MESEFDYVFKILIVGEMDTGKTSILLKYADNYFSSTYITTIVVDFKEKQVDASDKKVKLQIWDTSSQERYKYMTLPYYKAAQAFVLVYDITNKDTFTNLQSVYDEAKANAPEKVKYFVVGSKSDLEDKRAVTTDEGKKFAAGIGAEFLETSAKNNTNIQELFTHLTNELVSSQ